MLQWMGGSRRKVTTSRKSTQKRQKQYFEQRRRQQQLQDSVGSSCFEGGKTCSKHAENNRSLDILNLQNLSATGLEYNSSCFREARDNSVDDYASDQTIPLSPKIQSAQVIPSEPAETEEPRTSSSYSMETVFPKITARSSVDALGRNQKASNTADVKMDQLKSASQQQFSVVDMLCADEPSSCMNQSSEREAHVAFSIEGLGRVETETPVHSPETPSRTYHKSIPSPLKTARYSFKGLDRELVNLEFDSDAMIMHCADAPLDRSFMKSSSSRDKFDFSKPNKKMLDFDEFSLFDNDNNNLNDILGGDELYGHSTQMNENIWDDLPRDKLPKRSFDFSDKICMEEMDASDDFSYSMHSRKDRLGFEGCEWKNDRSTMRKACKFEPTGSPVPDFKYKSENFQNLSFSYMKWNPGIARNHDVEDLRYKPGPRFTYKEPREEESLLSEESCSSTAVSGVDKKTSGTLWLEDMFGTPKNTKFSEGSGFDRSGMPKLGQKTDDTGQRSNNLFRPQDDLVHEDEIIGDDKDNNVLQKDILCRAKSSSSENVISSAASESVLDHIKETPKEEKPKPKPKPQPQPQLDVIGKYQHEGNGQTSPLFQTRFGGIKDSGQGQRTTTSEGKKSSTSSPCQMIAVSYNIFAFRF